jgi:hypothetical protein
MLRILWRQVRKAIFEFEGGVGSFLDEALGIGRL